VGLSSTGKRRLCTAHVENGFAIGYDEQGDEVSRVPLKEPIYVRPVYDEKFGTYRSNIT